jgi:hypothetical protein
MKPDRSSLARRLNLSESHTKLFGGILLFAIIAGVGTGYFLSSSSSAARKITNQIPLNNTPETPHEDNRTFRDFAEGTIEKKPEPKSGNDYSEGTHLLKRDGAVPVALTSSVVDLSKFEGKKVKVLGETQKALKEGWLMDVGKVEPK